MNKLHGSRDGYMKQYHDGEEHTQLTMVLKHFCNCKNKTNVNITLYSNLQPSWFLRNNNTIYL